MNATKRKLGLAAGCTALVMLVTYARPVQAQRSTDDTQEAARILDAWAQNKMQLEIAVVHGSELVWSKQYGVADLRTNAPVTDRTLFRIASISKLFTATAIMQLRDAGKLRLDDPVESVWPAFKLQPAEEKGPKITIRNILTHTAGIPRESVHSYWNDFNFPSRDEMVNALPNQRAAFPAGSDRKYSNLEFALLGEVVAYVSGETYTDYVTKHILQPLGMTDTVILPTPSTPNMSIGYGRVRRDTGRRDAEPFVDPRGLGPASSFAASLRDLVKFAAFQNGAAEQAGVLSPWSLRDMQQIQWLRPDWTGGQGFGFQIQRDQQNKLRAFHAGLVPGFRTMFMTVPQDKVAVVALGNATNSDADGYAEQALATIGQAVMEHERREAAAKRPSTDVQALRKFEGTYFWSSTLYEDITITVIDGELSRVDLDSTSPMAGRVILKQLGPNTFRMMNGGFIGETVTFDIDASGNVTGFTEGVDRWKRRR